MKEGTIVLSAKPVGTFNTDHNSNNPQTTSRWL